MFAAANLNVPFFFRSRISRAYYPEDLIVILLALLKILKNFYIYNEANYIFSI